MTVADEPLLVILYASRSCDGPSPDGVAFGTGLPSASTITRAWQRTSPSVQTRACRASEISLVVIEVTGTSTSSSTSSIAHAGTVSAATKGTTRSKDTTLV